MPNAPKPDDEIKTKLRQIRSDYTRAQNIIAELEGYYAVFVKVRADLDDEDDGLVKNLSWSQGQKNKIDALVTEVGTKITELEEISTSVKSLADQVQAQYDSFLPLAARITDPSNGIDAMLTLSTSMKDNIAALVESATVDVDAVKTTLNNVIGKHDEVERAYDDFIQLKKIIDDPETGVEAQVAKVNQYAKDALIAKTGAESDLQSIVQAKENASEYFEAVKVTKEEVDALKSESEELTNDIRNTLGMTSTHSLSKELETQRKKLDLSVRLWGVAVALTVILLAVALGAIFYTLFLDKTSRDYLSIVEGRGVLLTVLSKALFTSPFIFALIFTTSNFSKAREQRDRYVAKEIAAKNLQAYVKLLRDEFPENSKERLDFTLHNMQSIYNDPVPIKKRSYNFGINRIFQFGVQEEDAQQLQDKLIQNAEEVVDRKPKSPKV